MHHVSMASLQEKLSKWSRRRNESEDGRKARFILKFHSTESASSDTT